MVTPLTPLEWARSQLGVREATGHNDGTPAERYLDGEAGLPWCAAFVLWCFRKGCCEIPGNRWKLRAVRELYRALRDAGAFVTDPAPGDIVFFNARLGSDAGTTGWHVGIVETAMKDAIGTIEGNAGDAVRRCNHSRANPRIVGYARWPRSQ